MRLIALLCLLAAPVSAVELNEILDDPVLEKRARSISAGLRCLQCQNESIDESNADIARDLRLLVRERLVEGDSDSEVVEFVTARYGEFVLLKPNGRGMNLVLWASGPVLLILTLGGLALVRRKPKDATSAPLSAEEEEKLAKLLGPGPGA
ncbi:MAG: cytochrome c-type biogenesis protein [Planktomarina sp.]